MHLSSSDRNSCCASRGVDLGGYPTVLHRESYQNSPLLPYQSQYPLRSRNFDLHPCDAPLVVALAAQRRSYMRTGDTRWRVILGLCTASDGRSPKILSSISSNGLSVSFTEFCIIVVSIDG